MPRFHCPLPLTPGNSIELPANAARHVQVPVSYTHLTLPTNREV